MEKENKKKNKPKSINRHEDVSLEKNIDKIEKEETIESNEPINDLGKIPGNGFGRVLGCG